ncbi:hypothetical protein PHJA_002846300 [Phtheirospermum japonicum]|uniref:Uncharacterized protein n=1 Tax=Phtheirospermum japonicum TaxID=374723 RepID=A0A830DMH2_9LAMI|nr:hypothetical protein PHJA_002846300 [Phtheirospermum japonicum]
MQKSIGRCLEAARLRTMESFFVGLQTSRAAHERSRAARVKARLELEQLELTNESNSSTSLISSRARRAARLCVNLLTPI